MARITVEDCLKEEENRFTLVHLAAKRVRQLRKGAKFMVDRPENRDVVIALREIAAAKVFKKDMVHDNNDASEDIQPQEQDLEGTLTES